MDYLMVKTVHIFGAMLIFGTGLGSAYYVWRANRSSNVAAIAVVTRGVVFADAVFTASAAVALPVTGLWMAVAGGHSLDSGWLLAAIGLFVVAGGCWLPVLWLQVRMARLSAAADAAGEPLPAAYHRSFRIWFWLGWPAFLSVITIVHLMVFKPTW